MIDLGESFWDNRYKQNNIGWDLGVISTPLKTYFDQLTNKDLKILIPGGGNSYEAEYLHNKGFKSVYVIDLSETAIANVKKRVPTFPLSHLIHSNFFELKMKFDLIIEQTFFCALNPNLRFDYVKKVSELLYDKGKLIGLLFNVPLFDDHPPFGGNKEDYIHYFKHDFQIKIMEPSYNSNKERKNKELFIKIVKPR